MTWPNYILIHLLNASADLASFASFGSWLQRIAPLYLKLFLRNSLFGLGSVRSEMVISLIKIPSNKGVSKVGRDVII